MEESNDKTIPGQTWHTYYFLGEAEGSLNLKPDEAVELVYLSLKDLANVDIAFNHREVLTQFFNRP